MITRRSFFSFAAVPAASAVSAEPVQQLSKIEGPIEPSLTYYAGKNEKKHKDMVGFVLPNEVVWLPISRSKNKKWKWISGSRGEMRGLVLE